MIVRTDCGHTFPADWTVDDFIFNFEFRCEICGTPQAIPRENILTNEEVYSINADTYYVSIGIPPERVTAFRELGVVHSEEVPLPKSETLQDVLLQQGT